MSFATTKDRGLVKLTKRSRDGYFVVHYATPEAAEKLKAEGWTEAA